MNVSMRPLSPLLTAAVSRPWHAGRSFCGGRAAFSRLRVSAAARSGFIVGTGYLLLANAGRRAAAACMASLDETTNRRLLAAMFDASLRVARLS